MSSGRVRSVLGSGRRRLAAASALALLWPAILSAAEPPSARVNVTVENVTHKMVTVEHGLNMKPARGAPTRRFDYTGPVVTLSNGLIEVKVVPTLGMRVLNAVDLATNRSFAGTPNPRRYEQDDYKDIRGWTAGYVEPSFPAFEHGMGVQQPAGFRVITRADGSATVAMNMRFVHHQHPMHKARYGRFSQRVLSGWVTLRPGESRYRLTYRADNPNPLPRSNRLWVNVLMHADRYDDRHILYPVGYATGHAGGGGLKALYGKGGVRDFHNVSFFAVYPDYDFAGAYSPQHDANCLIIKDRDAPGKKLYTPGGEGGFIEIWFGTNPVFEHSGAFLDPYVPTQQTLVFYAVSGIGRVDYANREVAIAVDGATFRLVAPRRAAAEVFDGGGKLLAKGKVGPRTPLKGKFDGRLVVRLDGEQVADAVFPLPHSDVSAEYEEVRKLGGRLRMELEEVSANPAGPSSWRAIDAARKLVEAGEADDAEQAVSLANTAYRHGHLDLALQVLKLVGDRPEADYLRGLIAWERGEKVDFGKAGLNAHYHRAMLETQAGDKRAAVRLLDELIKARPTVYRPGLMRAYLAKDVAAARALAEQNPASPEAQLVLELLGVEAAKQAKEALLNNNPEAPQQVERFRLELTKGKWKHARRYAPVAPSRTE